MKFHAKLMLALAVCSTAAPAAMASTDLPVCFRMVNDGLNRFYVIAREGTADPFYYTSAAVRPIRVLEYVFMQYQPQHLYMNDTLSGTASFDASGNITGVTSAAVTGADGASGGIMTTRIKPQNGGWIVERSTGGYISTTSTVQVVPCTQPTV